MDAPFQCHDTARRRYLDMSRYLSRCKTLQVRDGNLAAIRFWGTSWYGTLVNGAPNGFVTHPATPSCLHDRDIFHTHILLPSWTLSRQKEMMTSFDCCVAAIKRGQSVASGPSSDSPKSASNCSILFTVHWCRSTSRSHP